MRVSAEQYAEYYRHVLKRIADGYEAPASIASIALEWTLHQPACAYNTAAYECDMNCSSNDGEVKS